MMSNRRSRLPTLVGSLMALAFVAGAGAGVAGDRLLAPPVTVRVTLDDMSGMLDRLALTPAQRSEAERIVSRTMPRSHAIMVDVSERLRAVSDSVDAELRAILSPEQLLRLDSLRREPRFLLKRRTVTPGGVTVDTLLDTDTSHRQGPSPER
jgi:hypothetical protein